MQTLTLAEGDRQPSYNEASVASEAHSLSKPFEERFFSFSSIFSKVLFHFQTVNLDGLTDQYLLVLGLIAVSIYTNSIHRSSFRFTGSIWPS